MKIRITEEWRDALLRALREYLFNDRQLETELSAMHTENASLRAQLNHYHTAHDAAEEAFAERDRLRKYIEPDSFIAACIPGGNICDPQEIADSVRNYLNHILEEMK